MLCQVISKIQKSQKSVAATLWDHLHCKALYSQAVPSSQENSQAHHTSHNAIMAEQRACHATFDKDVAKIWGKKLEACKELATKHKKTLRRCLDAVFLGAKLANGKQEVVSKWKAFVAAMVKKVNASMIS
jgi:hypothetical protein